MQVVSAWIEYTVASVRIGFCEMEYLQAFDRVGGEREQETRGQTVNTIRGSQTCITSTFTWLKERINIYIHSHHRH